MKTTLSKIIFMGLMLGYTYTLSAHVELDYPQGGETLTVGQTVTIQWHIAIPHNTLNWDLLFSADGGATWEYIYQDLPVSNLSYQWIVPSTLTTQARVSVIQDNSETDYQDESMNFTIVAPPMPPFIVLGAMDTIIESDINNQDVAIQTWLDNHGGASATGFCGSLNWTDDFTDISNQCGASGSALVTFTATDECGSTLTSATVTIVDTAPPVMVSQASDLVVECDGNGNMTELNAWLESEGGAMATDAGGAVIWSNNYTALSIGCGTTGSASVIYTATDECGNNLTTSGTFTIEDHLAPAIQAPAQDTVIECGLPNTFNDLQNWLSNHGGALAIDQCGTIAWTNNFPELPDTCNASQSWSVTFSAHDQCGNSDTTTASVTLLGTSGISDPGLSALAMNISPNPVHDILKVTFKNDEFLFVRLMLFDAFGQHIASKQEEASEIYLPVSGFTSGIYFLRAETSQSVYTRKVVIE